ncbi:hypothetical protein CTheo_8018 [Ceratobasidium theobromae]|uniref:Uncharacterized protein n=1 Tax=Ceratobasidium theobromae TaxID=1582974 RepID=A0A5N5QAL4_9AGAM|nr:hypothetical protein CTheo_8018 [Ceratobasidium theobromae]
MPDIQNYVLENFEEDRPNIAPRAIQLLPLAVRLNSKWLELECFRSLAFRRRPISREELIALGPKMMAQATYVRERVRTAILSSGLPKAISLHASCSEPLSCFYFITQKVQANMTANPRNLYNFRSSDEDEADIFDISIKDTEFIGSKLCDDCQPIVNELSELIRFSDELSQEVHKCVQDSKLLVADK